MNDAQTANGQAFRGKFYFQLPNPSSLKILVVDDNDALRYSVVRSLREAGYQIAEAATGS